MSATDGRPEVTSSLPDPSEVLDRIVRAAVALVPHADGAVIMMSDPTWLTVVKAAGSVRSRRGLRVPIRESLSGTALLEGRILNCADASSDERVNWPVVEPTGIRSFVAMPVRRKGDAIAVFGVVSEQPGAFDQRDEAILAELSEFVGAVIGTAAVLAVGDGLPTEAILTFITEVLGPPAADTTLARQRIEAHLAGGEQTMVFQPIFDLQSGQMVSVEALARFPESTPDTWFAEAEQVGLGADLELAAVRAALAAAAALPDRLLLSLNVGPATVITPALAEALVEAGASRVILELTEHLRVVDYEPLTEGLRSLRSAGAMLSVDDAGAGYSSLARILEINPDFIKLDLRLTRGIDRDPVRRALATALVDFANASGAELIAEGIETEGELSVVRELGVHYGQGYHLGRPTPVELLRPGHRIGADPAWAKERRRTTRRRTARRLLDGQPAKD